MQLTCVAASDETIVVFGYQPTGLDEIKHASAGASMQKVSDTEGSHTSPLRSPCQILRMKGSSQIVNANSSQWVVPYKAPSQTRIPNPGPLELRISAHMIFMVLRNCTFLASQVATAPVSTTAKSEHWTSGSRVAEQ